VRVAASGVAGGGLGLWARAALAPGEVAAFIAGVRVPHVADAADADADADDADADADADADDDARGEGGEAGKRVRGIDWDWAAPSVDGAFVWVPAGWRDAPPDGAPTLALTPTLTLTLTPTLTLTLTPTLTNPNPNPNPDPNPTLTLALTLALTLTLTPTRTLTRRAHPRPVRQPRGLEVP